MIKLEMIENPESVKNIDCDVIVQEIAYIMIDNNINANIVFISKYENEGGKDKFKSLENTVNMICDSIAATSPTIIITSLYASSVEYPDDKYYNYLNILTSDTEGKEPIPFGKIMSEGDNKLKEIGFEDITEFVHGNDFVKYHVYTKTYPGKLLFDTLNVSSNN